MKTIHMTCPRCNASLSLERIGEHAAFFCPYCGNETRMLVDSDSVRMARYHEETEMARIRLMAERHRDEVMAERRLFRIRTGIICAVSLIVLVLALVWILG